jgi:hypothetical protein
MLVSATRLGAVRAMRGTTIVCLVLSFCVSGRVVGQTNSWMNARGNWEDTSHWSLHLAPSATQTILITNTGTFTITIDERTEALTPAVMTVSSLSISNSTEAPTLLLSNGAGSPTPIIFTVTKSASVGLNAVLNLIGASITGTGTVMQVSNLVANGSVTLQLYSTLTASGASTNYNVHLGSTATSTGTVTLLGGSLNGKIAIGEQGLGSLVMSNGFLQSTNVGVGAFSGGHGIWQIAGGTSTVTSLTLGSVATSTGQVVMTGGLLNTGSINLGQQGYGSLVISDGFLQSTNVAIGNLSGGHGVWQIAGGTSTVSGVLLGSVVTSTGEVVMTAGLLNTGSIGLGQQGYGSFVISNGFLQSGNVGIGALGGGHGIWQIAGGTSTVSGVLLGSTLTSTGEVVMTGGVLNAGTIGPGATGSGSLVLSNGAINAVELDLPSGLDVGGAVTGVGTLTIAGGTLNLSANMYIGYLGTGAVWVTGGELDVINPASNRGLIRLVSEGESGSYLSQLVCSGGVLRATEVDVGHPDAPLPGLSSWTIAGGTSIVNVAVYVSDNVHTGLLTVCGGLLQAQFLELGTESGGGSVVVSGGSIQVSQDLHVGMTPHGISQLIVSGGNVGVGSNFRGTADVGGGGAGQITVSSGTFSTANFYVGGSFANPGNQAGTLTISGGTVIANLLVGEGGGGTWPTGTVWYTGGSFQGEVTVGDTSFGNMYILSNAFFNPELLVVGNQNSGVGALTFQGGMSFTSPPIDFLEIGAESGSTGTVWVTDGLFQAGQPSGCSPVQVGVQGSGRLSATNAVLQIYVMSVGSQGTFECVNSQLLLFGSCASVNNNVMLFANSTGEFSSINNAGTIVANNSTLTFFQPVNNTGFIVATNGSVQFPGGITNSGVILLGGSQFCITSIAATGSDMAITWPVCAGNDYRVQASTNLAGGFSDISTDIVASGSGLGSTNYIDPGALTNNPGLYYRIRQIY